MSDTEPRPPQRTDSEFEHEVMAQCVDAWQQGGSDAAEAVLEAHPAIADVLRERLAKLARAGLLGPAESGHEIPEQLGEFRLRKRLGSGGMGVVFLAEQLTLGRTVALKLVRPEQRFFPGARERFRREVEAIARLGDAGIVPIHCVGQDQGIDFFAMEYVRGASLGDAVLALHATPPEQLTGRDLAVVAAARAEVEPSAHLAEVFAGTWVQTCCRVVARMARAAQHAHERGVVHRDIKPNNAMVTPDGRVLLLDFGLAAAAGASRITRSGAQLGTLHYMAPEQLREGDTDVRTDVYALGVTLYELLALRSPFSAESGELLRQQIVDGLAEPLRERNPDVPRDVETMLAVAMDRDPQRRYQTAQAFADDLERFLQHRPITARPIGRALRTVRWGQRHPAWATAVGLTIVALAATPFLIRLTMDLAKAEQAQEVADATKAMEAAEAKAREDRQNALDAAREAEAAKAKAREDRQNAIDAIDRILATARSPSLVRMPGLDGERARQIDDAETLMERMRAKDAADPDAMQLYVRGMNGVAEFRRLMGRPEAALAVLDKVDAALAATWPGERPPAVRLQHAAMLLGRGSACIDLGRVDEAAASWRAIIAAHDAADPSTLTPDLIACLATSHNNLGRIAGSEGDLDEAIARIERCIALESRIADANAARAIDAARTQMNLGQTFRRKGDLDKARAAYEAARDRLQKFAAKVPEDPELRREIARTEFGLGALAADTKDFATSVPRREAAMAVLQKLVGDFPDRAHYRSDLALMAHELVSDHVSNGDHEAAERMVRFALELMDQLLAKAPDNLEYRSQRATFLQQLSSVLLFQQRRQEAIDAVSQAVEVHGTVVAARPDDPHYRLVAAGLYQEKGVHYWRAEEWADAREAWRGAEREYQHALRLGSKKPLEPRRLPQLLMFLAQTELRCDDLAGVVAVLQRRQAVAPLPSEHLADAGLQLHVAERDDFKALLAATKANEAAAATKDGKK